MGTEMDTQAAMAVLTTLIVILGIVGGVLLIMGLVAMAKSGYNK
jgi:hypothetical protein